MRARDASNTACDAALPGAHLATFADQATQDTVMSAMGLTPSATDYWFGLDCPAHDMTCNSQGAGVWTWLGGAAPGFMSWSQTPNKGTGCARLTKPMGSYLWRDANCNTAYFAVCQPLSRREKGTFRSTGDLRCFERMRGIALSCLVLLVSVVACAKAGTDPGPGDQTGAGGDSSAGAGGGAGSDAAGSSGSGSGGKSGSSTGGKAGSGGSTGGSSSGGKGGTGGGTAGSGGGKAGTGGTGTSGSGGSGTSGSGTSGSPGVGGGPSSLDPALSPASASGQLCSDVGVTGGTCPAGVECRIYDGKQGRCEGCSPCNKLAAACKSSVECGVSPAMQCYAGTCRELCPLSKGTCTMGGTCHNIGADVAGVCF
jgi:hypothetical protein